MDPYLKTLLTHTKTTDGRQGCVLAFGRSPLKVGPLETASDGHAAVFHPDTLLDVLCMSSKRFPEVVIACEVDRTPPLTISTLVADKELADQLTERFVYNPSKKTQRTPFDLDAVSGTEDIQGPMEEETRTDKTHWQPLLEAIGHFVGLFTDDSEYESRHYIVAYCGIPETMDEKLDELWDVDNQVTVSDFVKSPLYERALECCRRLAKRLAFEFAAHCKLRIQVEQDTRSQVESDDHSYPFVAVPTYEELVNVFHEDSDGNIHFYNMCSRHTDSSLHHIRLNGSQRTVCISEKVHRTISTGDRKPSLCALFPVLTHHPEYYHAKRTKPSRRRKPKAPVYYMLAKTSHRATESHAQPKAMSEGWTHRHLFPRLVVMNQSPVISHQ